MPIESEYFVRKSSTSKITLSGYKEKKKLKFVRFSNTQIGMKSQISHNLPQGHVTQFKLWTRVLSLQHVSFDGKNSTNYFREIFMNKILFTKVYGDVYVAESFWLFDHQRVLSQWHHTPDQRIWTLVRILPRVYIDVTPTICEFYVVHCIGGLPERNQSSLIRFNRFTSSICYWPVD